MEFENGLEQGKKILKSIGKKKAFENLERIKQDILNNDVTEITGFLFAETITFFDPPINKKSDINFVCSALGKKTDKRWYTQFAVVLPGIGLCATDSSRLHILKGFENEKPIYNPVTKTWFTEKELDRDLSMDYPPVKDAVLAHKPETEIELNNLKNEGDEVIIEKDGVACHFNKKYVYDAIGSFTNPKLYWKPGKEPLWIEDDTKLSIIMPIYK
ncbi:MAG: hypothetical protein EOM23_01750 [Candidatus Moranbacteria bacterium]|nr:hypothetical protein [Candidatus Moranbacteria bacterium]